MANTVHHVNQVVQFITAIKEAGQEQARGIAQIGEAVRHLDAATQQNAALVDDNSSASTGMKNQVKRLLEVIHQFRLAPDRPEAASVGVATHIIMEQTGHRSSATLAKYIRPLARRKTPSLL